MNPNQFLREQQRTPIFALTVMLLVAAVVGVNETAFGAIHALQWKALQVAGLRGKGSRRRTWVATRLGVRAFDLPTLAGVSGVFAAIGLTACWLPARRAANTNPVVA